MSQAREPMQRSKQSPKHLTGNDNKALFRRMGWFFLIVLATALVTIVASGFVAFALVSKNNGLDPLFQAFSAIISIMAVLVTIFQVFLIKKSKDN